MRVPEGLAIAPAHFLTAPEEEYREYIEGDQHKHHVVKIDSVNGKLKMKLFGSFTRVEHRFSFSTEALTNENFCFLTTGITTGFGLFGQKGYCNHAIRKSFVISRKLKRCPHLDGALVLNLLCQAVATDEENLQQYLESAPEPEECLYKYPWDQLVLHQEYKVDTRFGDAVMAIPFSFIQLCKANGMLRLEDIHSKLPFVNCKEIRPHTVSFYILERKEERSWKPFGRKEENWEIVHRFSMFLDPCKHPEECNMKHFGTKNNRKKVKGRRTQATGDSVEQTTSGSNNKIQGGSVIHSDNVTFNMTVQKD